MATSKPSNVSLDVVKVVSAGVISVTSQLK